MKKQFMALSVLGASLLVFAAKSSDPVLMNIAGKDVHVSEFEYLYNKNNSQQVQPQTIDEYLNMFIDYKLKVADAEAAGIDTTAQFLKEFTQFRNELADPYMQDTTMLNSMVREVYDHMSSELLVSHIMMRDGAEATLDSLRTAILDGRTTFEDVAQQYSIDKPSAQRGGLMGTVTANRYPWPFEKAAYDTPVGGISPVINSGYGLHIIRVEKREPARGEVLVEHILRLTRGMSDSVAAAEAVRIDSIYNVVTAPGADFGEIASRLSQDPGSARRGGRLDWFGTGMMVQEFDSVAFALPVGAYSKPFRTAYGWHIIHKIDARGVPTFEEKKQDIINAFGRDERGNAPREAYLKQMITRYKAQVLHKDLQKLSDIIGETAEYDSTLIATLSRCDIPAFEVNGVKGTVADVMPKLAVAKLIGRDNIIKFITDGANRVMCDRVLDCAREDLANVNPDYRNLVNEYRDGILLFEISNRTVWDRASKDTKALEAYFAANKDKYQWEAPKFKSYVIFTTNDSLLQEALKFAPTIPADLAPADFTAAMRERFGRDVKVERVIAAKGENAITDYLAFGGARPESANSHWTCYAAFGGRVIDAPEEAADVRGKVVADYQAELERQWLDELHRKYKVKVNNKVFNSLK